MMKYSIDFQTISISSYKDFLKTSSLIPSHKVLLEQIDQRFSLFEEKGITNLDDVQRALKTKQKIEAFADTAGIPQDYLIVLNRAVSSLHPPPRELTDFPGLSMETASQLSEQGIQNSMQFFNCLVLENGTKTLLEMGYSYKEEMEHAFKISSLCRLRYVSPVFANLLIAANCGTIEKTADADADALYEKIKLLNADHQFFNGKIGLNDIRFLINDAKYFRDKL